MTTILSIQRATAEYFGVTVNDLKSGRVDKITVRARHVAMFLCRHETTASLPKIGREFGNRDHTAVMYAIKKIDRELGCLKSS